MLIKRKTEFNPLAYPRRPSPKQLVPPYLKTHEFEDLKLEYDLWFFMTKHKTISIPYQCPQRNEEATSPKMMSTSRTTPLSVLM